MLLLGLHLRSSRVLALAALAASPLACVRENPAFDTNDFADESVGSGDGDGDTGDGDGGSGDGDGDSGDGDGDSGDGDGDSGDGDSGDGDGDSGDGDGDSGDGDGDGDGDSGDGDGDGDTGDGDGDGDTGDGDGDPIEELCQTPLSMEDFFPFQIESLSVIETNNAPGFDLAPQNCLLMMICTATQDFCDPMNPYMLKIYSNGNTVVGEPFGDPQALQIRFHPGGGFCGNASLDLDPSQSLALQFWNGQGFEQLPIRLPCLTDYNVPIYIAQDGSTFWDIELTLPAALWP